MPCRPIIGGSADLTGSNGTKTDELVPITPGDYGRPLPLLRRARACHGRGDERHGAPRRRHPLRRHLPHLHRLLPPGDPAVRAHGASRHLRDDPRFHRPRRGRADPSAHRAPGEPARDAQPAAVPAGGCRGDGGVLGACARQRRASRRCWRLTRQGVPCLRAGEGGNGSGECLRPGRLRAARGERRHAPRRPARHRLGTARSPTRRGRRWRRMACRRGWSRSPAGPLFDAQEPAWRESVLGDADTGAHRGGGRKPPRLERYVGPAGAIVGMRGFGASAPARTSTPTSVSRPTQSSPRPRRGCSALRTLSFPSTAGARSARLPTRYARGAVAPSGPAARQGREGTQAAPAFFSLSSPRGEERVGVRWGRSLRRENFGRFFQWGAAPRLTAAGRADSKARHLTHWRKHDGSHRHQRVRPDRPQHPARDSRIRPHRPCRRRPQRPWATWRPTPTCCATIRSTGASPAPSK